MTIRTLNIDMTILSSTARNVLTAAMFPHPAPLICATATWAVHCGRLAAFGQSVCIVAGLTGSAGDLGERRQRIRHQCMESDTAVRHGAKCVFIVSNNAAWNIERLDQEINYGVTVFGTPLRHSDFAAMGAGPRVTWRARRRARRLAPGAAAGIAECTGAGRLTDVADSLVIGCAEGPGFCARLPGAHRVG
jgi:hypothetical protein